MLSKENFPHFSFFLFPFRCQPGTLSLGIRLPCSPCADGSYTSASGSSSCLPCNGTIGIDFASCNKTSGADLTCPVSIQYSTRIHSVALVVLDIILQPILQLAQLVLQISNGHLLAHSIVLHVRIQLRDESLVVNIRISV